MLLFFYVAMTSVFPDEATVYFNEGDTTVHFSYFIYSSQSDLPVTVFHNGMPATDLNLFSDETSCVRSTISEFAVILIVTIINPTFASAGEYELVVDESLSAVATLGECVHSSYVLVPVLVDMYYNNYIIHYIFCVLENSVILIA